jgi:DNA-binding response OmpR family regulator
MTIVKVRVLITEDDQEVGAMYIEYWRDQDYVVQVVTPDGVDSSRARKAGATELRSLTPEDFGHPVKS